MGSAAPCSIGRGGGAEETHARQGDANLVHVDYFVAGCAVAAERPDVLVAPNAYAPTKSPLSFEPNYGQTDARVKFLTRAFPDTHYS